jgi:hypothetical protein
MRALSDQERIARIARTMHVWIKYSRGEEALQLLEDRLAEPQSHRMRNILIVGDTNSGKTRLARRFLRRHRAVVSLSQPSVVPLLCVEATAADESRFYNTILEELPVYKNGQTARADLKEELVLRAMRECGIRMLLIDEFHNLLNAPTQKQNNFRRVIRTIGNRLMIPIVALGTRDAFNAISLDPQLANRFQVIVLPKWKLDDEAKVDRPSEYRQFLASFERLLPFDISSDLGNDPMAAKIYALSEGTIGEATDLVRDAAKWALRNGCQQVTEEALECCGYVPPSRRTLLPCA